jgi:signal transduction histidine kinase
MLMLFATTGIIFSNRIIAQFFLAQQLQDAIHVDMGRALATCSEQSTDKHAFLTCFKMTDQASVISNASDFYVLCQPPELACPGIFDADALNLTLPQPDVAVDYWRGYIHDELWMAVRQVGHIKSLQIWIKSSDADVIRQKLWGLRDQNLWRVAPFIFLFLMILSWVAAKIIMRPIHEIEQSISRLNANNLGESIQLKAPYQEFESLVNVYKNLLHRLNESFINARRFASDASHELRTPLTILRGNTEQLIAELPVGSELQVRVRGIGDEVERLIDITEKLLLLSRADANSLGKSFTDVDLSQLLTQFIKPDDDEELSFLTLSHQIEPGVMWHCDKTLALQLIHNLFENAQKYNMVKGWIRVTLMRDHGRFQLMVENPSLHIPPELTRRAFDRFYRGDASHTRQIDGLGLGLSICAEIARIHHGLLTLRITEKKTVLLTLSAPLSGIA